MDQPVGLDRRRDVQVRADAGEPDDAGLPLGQGPHLVEHDPVDPGLEGRPPFEGPDGLGDRQPRVLYDLLGQRRRHVQPGEADERCVQRTDEVTERVGVPPAKPGEQGRLVAPPAVIRMHGPIRSVTPAGLGCQSSRPVALATSSTNGVY
jgi:hypothetical protein